VVLKKYTSRTGICERSLIQFLNSIHLFDCRYRSILEKQNFHVTFSLVDKKCDGDVGCCPNFRMNGADFFKVFDTNMASEIL